MYPTAPFHTFFLLAFTILFLACSSVVTGTAEDFQIAEGEVLPSGFEYTPRHMTGTIGEIALNHTGTIEEILAQVTTENPGFKVEDALTVGGPTINTLDNLAKVISTSSTRNCKHALLQSHIHYLLLTLTFLLLINTALAVPSGSLHPLQDEIEGNRITNKTADFSTTDVVAARYEQTKSDFYCYPFSGQPTWRPAEARYIRDGIAYLQRVTALCWVDGHKCSRISCSYKSAISLCNVTPVRKGLSCSYMTSYAQDILDRCTYNVGLMRFVGGQYWDTEGYNINVYRDTSC
ncbi:hypothetical protein IFR04_015768 [Cadophora malorum]|uniref:Uncharacterized protein n=1 Tax=Cadophora malorum TaxID=108018 RepID=A0A8H7T2J1_9HELO|nr:hypothetical protein IFR04_015768 [Cadophora malorum]